MNIVYRRISPSEWEALDLDTGLSALGHSSASAELALRTLLIERPDTEPFTIRKDDK
jgi:hypothetical protein